MKDLEHKKQGLACTSTMGFTGAPTLLTLMLYFSTVSPISSMCITEIHNCPSFFAPAFEYFIAEAFWLAHVALCVFYTNPGINLFSRGGRLPPEIHFQAQVELP